jgi:ABC-type lipoprotein export system ATPase subunit
MPEHNRKACLSNTRQDVIKVITSWIADESSDHKSVLWLYGLAGSGKSTLSTTIAWMMQDLHRLGAFFFFDRDIPERNAATLIRTLAHQLAQFDAHIGEHIKDCGK